MKLPKKDALGVPRQARSFSRLAVEYTNNYKPLNCPASLSWFPVLSILRLSKELPRKEDKPGDTSSGVLLARVLDGPGEAGDTPSDQWYCLEEEEDRWDD